MTAGQTCPGTEACPSVQQHVKLTDENIAYIRELMKQAVAEGITNAMTADAARTFWSVGLEIAQEQARIRAGRFVLDGLWALLRKGFWVLVFLAAVHAVGGWALVATLWKSIFAKG